MKKLFFVLLGVALLAAPLSVLADSPMQIEQLPDQAKRFIKSYFGDVQVASATLDGGVTKSYEVMFVNSAKVEFDGKGQWTDIQTPMSVVPSVLIPKQIADYLSRNHPGQRVVGLERERFYWQIEVDNGNELKFDKKFRLIEVDH